MPLKIH